MFFFLFICGEIQFWLRMVGFFFVIKVNVVSYVNMSFYF